MPARAMPASTATKGYDWALGHAFAPLHGGARLVVVVMSMPAQPAWHHAPFAIEHPPDRLPPQTFQQGLGGFDFPLLRSTSCDDQHGSVAITGHRGGFRCHAGGRVEHDDRMVGS